MTCVGLCLVPNAAVKKFPFCNRKGTARAIVMSCEQCSDIINLGHGALY